MTAHGQASPDLAEYLDRFLESLPPVEAASRGIERLARTLASRAACISVSRAATQWPV